MKKIILSLLLFIGLTATLHATHSYDGCSVCVGEQGPIGEQGPQGEQGIQGERGEQGLRGLSGLRGLNGTNGSDGINGVNGTDGVDGADGANGTTTLEHTYSLDETEIDALKSSYQKQAERVLDAMDGLAEQGLNLSAGANAVSAIDFNADHKGHSIGFGYGFGNTWKDYRGGAGALGYQYAWTHKEYDVSVVVKSWAGKQETYGVGFGGVIGF